MIKALLLDCGGVMVSPVTGDWLLPPGFEKILGADFPQKRADAFRNAKHKAFHLIPDLHVMQTDEEECTMLCAFYELVFNAEMGLGLSSDAVAEIARLQTYSDHRYDFFDDVGHWLNAWRGRYLLGMVSDAPPSLRRIMMNKGYWQLLDAPVLSCDLGVLKPDPRIYQAALTRLNVQPEEAVFVDDIPSKLQGAHDLGVLCVQMRRPMPKNFPPASPWDGPSATDFRGLDALLRTLG